METTTVTLAKRGVKCSFSLRLSESQPLSLPSPIQHCCAPGSTEHHPTRSLVLKKECSNSPPLLRCKRNANISGLNYPFPQQPLASVVRRNERERNRVRQVNAGFQTLRQHVPIGVANNGKLSKVETLRSAVEYIRALQQVLEESDAVSKIFQSGSIPYPSMTVSSSISPGPESPNSTYSSSSEDGCSYGNVSSEECELLDFTSLFHRF